MGSGRGERGVLGLLHRKARRREMEGYPSIHIRHSALTL